MIIKTTGIVLRTDPFSKTSTIISWLTRDMGRVTTLAKGARRANQHTIGHHDCFYTCELIFYLRKGAGVHTLKECTPIDYRAGLWKSWRSVFSASYLCDLVRRVSEPETPNASLFAWTEATLNFLTQHASSHAVLLWSELSLLTQQGLAPRLSGCLTCRNTQIDRWEAAYFSPVQGGLLCPDCHLHTPLNNMRRVISHGALAIMHAWSRGDLLTARRTRCTYDQRECIDALIGEFMSAHLDIGRSREIITRIVAQ